MPEFTTRKTPHLEPFDVSELPKNGRQRPFDPHKRCDEPGYELCLVRVGRPTSWRARVRPAFVGTHSVLRLPGTCRSRSQDAHHPSGHHRSEPDKPVFHHGLRYCDALFLFFLGIVVWFRSFNALSGRHDSGHLAYLHWAASVRNFSDLRRNFSSLGANVSHSLRECACECRQGQLRISASNEEKRIVCSGSDSISLPRRRSPDGSLDALKKIPRAYGAG